ncbi:hypothetical protein OG226_09595 [Streptomyces sp. NBC_01261]|uniref:hypothetical protein n=1 Tax=Streptomyces sp. NBC_01261 TaxID=2903802 RepID=UPI002E343695|nr:hypothetical protein [Streptomyces sp. NBC_01261]
MSPVERLRSLTARKPGPASDRTDVPGSVLALDVAETAVLAEAAHLLACAPDTEPEDFCAQARRAAGVVPGRIRDRLAAFAWGCVTDGHLLITGLPLPERVPPAPPTNHGCVAAGTVTTRAQAILNECVGHTLAYEAEGHGHLFQDVVPSRAHARTQTSQSSEAELDLHTEQAFSALRPDYLSLACLRGAPDALTFLLPAKDLCTVLTAQERRSLREPLWTTTVDQSFLDTGLILSARVVRGPMPILRGAEDDPFIVFDHDLMRGISDEAEVLRTTVQQRYLVRRIGLSLAPGEMVLIDNRRAMHGRSVFAARYDGTDRFVSRSFVTADPARSRHARPGNGRSVAAAFC